MILRGFKAIVACTLATAWCALLLASCDHSPSAPTGQLVVHVSQNGSGSSPGKVIEIVGTTLRQTTDADGIAQFTLAAGSHVVRAYDIGTPGPGRPYVEQTVDVPAATTSHAEFNDCTLCR